jgi:hypothetical protein
VALPLCGRRIVMGSDTPVRDQLGTIVGLRPKDEPDPVQATLDASLKAVGATEPTPKPSEGRQTLQRPSGRLITTGVAVLSIGILIIVLVSGRSAAPRPAVVRPTVTTLPTVPPTVLPSIVPQANPREVTLPAITLYGDYDEDTKIGSAPEGIVCTISGQSPDGLWVFLTCPSPTGKVWAKVSELGLSADQRSVLLDSRVIARIVPTAPAFSSPPIQGTGSAYAFCTDRSSIWGKTRQCAATQAAADALADSEMRVINATAEAIQKR